MINGIHVEVLLASAYALFLCALATFLEVLARKSQLRSQQYHTAGFTFQAHLNTWRCPAGEDLKLTTMDADRRIARYRAPAKSCNSCSLKQNCTNSDDGRELEHQLDSWLQSELRLFHKGISGALLLLAGLILSIEASRHNSLSDLRVILIAGAPVAMVCVQTLSEFRAH
jgi:DDE family transposase